MTRQEMIAEHDRLVALFDDEDANFPTQESAFETLDLIATYEIVLLAGEHFSQKRPPEVQAKIAEGMRQADENADGRWKHVFDCCVLAAAKKKPEITSDDVLAEIEALPNPPDTHNLAAIGPAMKRAQQMGILSYTDRVKRSDRPEKHGNRQNVWVSNYWKP